MDFDRLRLPSLEFFTERSLLKAPYSDYGPSTTSYYSPPEAAFLDTNINPNGHAPIVGAVYFMTNDPRENSIISNSIQPDGRLGYSKSFRTRGFGGYVFNVRNISGEPDALGSHNGLLVSDDLLFAVNAGSNSVSMFTIQPSMPTDLNFITTVSSGGHFPVALAFSPKRQMLCVANSGEQNGIQCFSFSRDKGGTPDLVPLPLGARPLGAPSSTPPKAYNPSVSDLIFSPDSSQLLVSVKRDLRNRDNGFIASYPVGRLGIGNPVRNQPRGSVSPFGMIAVPGTGITSEPIIAFTDPVGNGIGLAQLSGRGVVEASAFTIVPDQINLCWTVFSPRSGNLFTTDTGAGVVTESAINVNTLRVQIINQVHVSGFPLDATVASLRDRDVLYILTPGLPGIQALSLVVPGHAQIFQQYTPGNFEFPLNTGAQGIAHYLIP